MKKEVVFLVFLLCSFVSCNRSEPVSDFDFVASQLKYAIKQIDAQEKGSTPVSNPRSENPDGSLHMVPSGDWTSGFFPGELWYMYAATSDDYWKEEAMRRTEILEKEKKNGTTHDMGFKMYCSYGNGYRYTRDSTYKNILLESARTLVTRFNEKVGCIRSWDHNKDKWQFPVIIDNMMNLELLFWAFHVTHDSIFWHVAVSHANTTLKNHFRSDNSSYHVVDYDPETGEVLNRHTHQGYSHESAWARGQAWGLYGYIVCFRETGDPAYLTQAKRIAEYIFTNPNLPEDLIPYWDYNAPNIPNEPRDVSAAAITLSALYELAVCDFQNYDKHKELADRLLENLKAYRAHVGKDQGFLLLHSTGSKPHDSEVDVPLVYADYYYLEALLRKKNFEERGVIH